jgi:aspartyl protease family protein
MFNTQVKFAIGLSVSALVSAQVLAHFHPHFRQSQMSDQPIGVDNSIAQIQVVKNSVMPITSGLEHRIAADRRGQYFTTVEVDRTRLRMLVDTGATSVALSYEDAAAAGILPFPSDYKYAVSTANGTGRVARVMLDEVRVGPLVVRDVEAVVGERGALSSSLLGMTFLSKLAKIESAGGTLVLRQ